MGLDDRIGPKFLQAGIGFGGSCFPKDVDALKQLAGNSGYHFQLLNAVIEVNELQKRRVIGKLAAAPRRRSSASASRCSAWPSSPNTDDMREASSLVLSARLQADGAQSSARTTRSPRSEARKLIRGHRLRRLARSRRSTAPTRSCSSPSGREFARARLERGRRGDARRRS